MSGSAGRRTSTGRWRGRGRGRQACLSFTMTVSDADTQSNEDTAPARRPGRRPNARTRAEIEAEIVPPALNRQHNRDETLIIEDDDDDDFGSDIEDLPQPLRGQRRRGRRTRTNSEAANATCIDLTNDDEEDEVDAGIIDDDDDVIDASFVDLTHGSSNASDSPMVIIGSQESRDQNTNGPSPRRRRQRSNPSDDSIMELPDLDFPPVPFDVGGPTTSNNSIELASTSNDSIVSSPDAKKSITCPVCLDDAKHINRRGNQLMATVCGHIFCKNCITAAIQAQHKCPTCRKKLNQKQVHPLFI